MELALHPKTKAKLAALAVDLPHAVLLTGKPGVGLTTIARHLAGRDLADYIEPIDSKEAINHESGTIAVATIRRLYEQTRSKHIERQIIVIDDAERMSLGAQAAFLKLLEEPAANTHFILTSHSAQKLLPTIRSRVQTVTITPLSAEQTKEFMRSLGTIDTKKQAQLQYLGEGLPAELTRLATNEEYFNQRAEIMADTRTLLTGSTYQKLLIVHKYQQSRQKALQLLDSALTVSQRSLTAKPQMSLVEQLERLHNTREKIEANCNIRLQLMAFVVY